MVAEFKKQLFLETLMAAIVLRHQTYAQLVEDGQQTQMLSGIKKICRQLIIKNSAIDNFDRL